MRDVTRHESEKLAEWVVNNGLMKRGMAHPRADAQHLAVALDAVEAFDLVDVHEMRRLGQAKRHDRHQALPAGQHAAILRRDLRQNLQCLVQRLRHMANERRGLHAVKAFGGRAAMRRANYMCANDNLRTRIVKRRLCAADKLGVTVDQTSQEKANHGSAEWE